MEIRYTMRKPPESANITMDRIQEIAKNCGTYPVLIYCLITRGFTEQDILDLFNDKSPLKHLRNADRAAYIIAGHLKENHKIEIFADYDVDGITSGYLMYYGLAIAKEIIGSSSEISVYYPQRSEGYGINIDFCKKAIENKTGFVITVDNGISKKEEIKYLKDSGIDVLVTDHHEPNKNNIPDCLIVNPCYNDTSRSYLAGVGVVYHVVLELLRSFEEKLNWYDIPMSIVMLGTISDVMPISPENSYFIKHGLDELNNGRGNYFLNKMKEYDTNIEYTPKDISFTVAPRLNAASRMGDTNLGADGFFSHDDDKIQNIIKKLETTNKDRKSITDKAKKAIEKLDPKDARIVAFNGKKFKDGTHGIIAGEITKRFEDLVGFVYSEKEPGILSGSVRCNNPNLDLPRLFKEQKDLGNLLSYAGHASACVISVEKKKLKEFVKSFSKSFDSLKPWKSLIVFRLPLRSFLYSLYRTY